jgi:hypothetical protein
MPAEPRRPEAATIATLAHDLVKKRSIVTLIWGDGSERRIALPVPWDTIREAENAVRQFASEPADTPIKGPD